MASDERRDHSTERTSARREVRAHAVVYLVANVAFVLVWAWSDVDYFWPVWPIVGWGIALVVQAARAYRPPGSGRRGSR